MLLEKAPDSRICVYCELFISAVGKPVQRLPENRTCQVGGQKQYIIVFQAQIILRAT